MVELKDTRLFYWNFRSTDLQKTGVSFSGFGWFSSFTKNRTRQKMKKLVELNLEITKVQVQGKMFDISEQKIAQLVSGCG